MVSAWHIFLVPSRHRTSALSKRKIPLAVIWGSRSMMDDKEHIIARLEALDTYLAGLDYYPQFSFEEVTADL